MNDPTPLRRFYLRLHYDGTRFFGWQVQPDQRTVQGELEAALERLTGTHRSTMAAGRTDRGVHATGQVASVALPAERWAAEELQRALRAILPADLWVEEVHGVPDAFHPRYDAVARRYRYLVGTSPNADSPFLSPFCWPVHSELDRPAMDRCADRVVGDHSFLAFAKSGQEERGDRCVVAEARWEEWSGDGLRRGLFFEIVADRFLHHMVRYLVGTMVEIGAGRRPEADFEALLTGPSEKHLITSPPAPAKGLYLTGVRYPDSVFGPEESPREPPESTDTGPPVGVPGRGSPPDA